MIENIVSIKLPADEELTIKKNRLKGAVEDSGKRIAIVTGIHGDELEGQYVCYELVRRITANTSRLRGIVDIYPSINPLGMESVTRAVPMSGLDMNKVFPGSDTGAIAENVAAKLAADNLIGSIIGRDHIIAPSENLVGQSYYTVVEAS